MENLLKSAFEALNSTNNHEGRVLAIRDAVDSLPDELKAAFREAVGKLLPPDETTSNKVWLIIIWAFTLVMIGSVFVLCFSLFTAPVKDATKPETILTIFTTVTAFLAGLFAPSPVAKKQ